MTHSQNVFLSCQRSIISWVELRLITTAKQPWMLCMRLVKQLVMVCMGKTVWQVIRCLKVSFFAKRAAKDLVAHYETVAKLPESLSELDLEDYQDQESLEEDYKKMVLEKLTEQNQLVSCIV